MGPTVPVDFTWLTKPATLELKADQSAKPGNATVHSSILYEYLAISWANRME